MRAGAQFAFAFALAAAAASPACADAIVKIVNKANTSVTVRVDGSFGCRAQSKATAPADVDMSEECTFGTTTGVHTLEVEFDGKNTFSKSIDVPATGYSLTLNGAE
jgi:hypothetical protein